MKIFLYAALGLMMLGSAAHAHEAPDTPVEPGPVPQVLMDHAPVMLYENDVVIPFVVRPDKTLFWIEMLPKIEKSFAGPATWTWEDNEFCMFIDNHPTVCFALESELQPGKIYDSTVRYLNDEGEETGSKPFRFILIRTS